MFFPEADTRQFLSATEAAPPVVPELGAYDTLSRNWTDGLAGASTMRQDLALRDIWEDEAQRFRAISGHVGNANNLPYASFHDEVDAWNAAHPDQPFTLPTDDEIQKRIDAKVRGAQTDLAALGTQPQSLLGRVAGFAGSMAASVADPVNIAALVGTSMLGAPESVGVVGKFLIGTGQDAVGMGLGQVGNEALNWQQNRRLDPEYSLRTAAGNVGEAALTGAEFGAGSRLIGAAGMWTMRRAAQAWRDFRAAAPDVPVDRPTMDAGNIVTHAANIDAANPFPDQGEPGAVAHAAAVSDAMEAADSGVPFSPSDDLAAARAADEQVRPEPAEALPVADTGVPVDQMARRMAPDLFTRADALDDDIKTARLRIANLISERQQLTSAAPATGGSMIEAANARIEDLQQQIAAFTGKRRTSPAAKEARSQLAAAEASLKAAEAIGPRMAGQSVEALDRRIALQRQALVEKLNDRGRLGPEINAATTKAQARIDARARNEAGRVRNAAARGEVPKGADFSADLERAQSLIHEASARGKPVGQTMAGLDFVDGVNPRVRALVGLLHEDETLSTPLPPEAAAQRISDLADAILAKSEPEPARKPPADTEARIAERAALDSQSDEPANLTPDAREATVMNANRLLLSRPDLEIPVHIGDDAEGQPIHRMMKLSDVLEAADMEKQAASELKACALGRSE